MIMHPMKHGFTLILTCGNPRGNRRRWLLCKCTQIALLVLLCGLVNLGQDTIVSFYLLLSFLLIYFIDHLFCVLKLLLQLLSFQFSLLVFLL